MSGIFRDDLGLEHTEEYILTELLYDLMARNDWPADLMAKIARGESNPASLQNWLASLSRRETNYLFQFDLDHGPLWERMLDWAFQLLDFQRVYCLLQQIDWDALREEYFRLHTDEGEE